MKIMCAVCDKEYMEFGFANLTLIEKGIEKLVMECDKCFYKGLGRSGYPAVSNEGKP